MKIVLIAIICLSASFGQSVSSYSAGGPLNGTASGALAGTYPAPTLATQAANTVLCNATGSTAAPTACTSSDLVNSLGMVVATPMNPGPIVQSAKWTVANSGSNFLITNPDATTSTVAKAAGVTQSVVMFALPAKAVITSCYIKSNTAFTGTLTLTGSVGVTGSLTGCLGVYDLQAAVSNTNLSAAALTTPIVSIAGTNLILALVSTIDNLTSVSAGSVSVWITWSILP